MKDAVREAAGGADMTFDVAASRRRCLAYRRRILDISQQAPAVHAAPAFSCVEMVDVVYRGLLRADRDIFLMSKGHGCLAQYVVLQDLAVLDEHDVELYCKPGGHLGAHPDYGVPGIAASTGSLGHGLGMGVGMAYAERIKREDRRIYVLISDGELQEGSTWEALMMAANLKLDNLVALVDLNDFSSLERMSEGHPAFYPLVDKLAAFGWEVRQVNGHDAEAVHEAIAGRKGDRPFILVGQTIKGKGVAYMENVPIWHYRSPNPEELAVALAGLCEVSS